MTDQTTPDPSRRQVLSGVLAGGIALPLLAACGSGGGGGGTGALAPPLLVFLLAAVLALTLPGALGWRGKTSSASARS